MQMKIVSGASLAAAAIALAVSGVAMTSSAQAGMKTAAVHCFGINSCKGKGACKSAKNSCKGHNSCKGMGWLPEKSAAACHKAGGKVG